MMSQPGKPLHLRCLRLSWPLWMLSQPVKPGELLRLRSLRLSWPRWMLSQPVKPVELLLLRSLRLAWPLWMMSQPVKPVEPLRLRCLRLSWPLWAMRRPLMLMLARSLLIRPSKLCLKLALRKPLMLSSQPMFLARTPSLSRRWLDQKVGSSHLSTLTSLFSKRTSLRLSSLPKFCKNLAAAGSCARM